MSTRRVAGLAVCAVFALLMGFEGPGGCAGSQALLSERGEGQTDYYLIGRWHDVELGDDGEFKVGPLRLEVDLMGNGDLSFVLYQYEDDWYERSGFFRGYTARIGARKYLNLHMDLSKYDEESRGEFEWMPCQFFIVQYTTFLPRAEALAATRRCHTEYVDQPDGEPFPIVGVCDDDIEKAKNLLNTANEYSGELLFYSEMDNDFVEESIEAGVIEGITDCDDCIGACIQADESELRAFVEQNDEDLFYDWIWLIREKK